MKAYSNFLALVLAVTLLFCGTANAAVTEVETGDNLVLKWATEIGSGWQKPAGVPLIVNDSIIIMSGDELYVVESENGEIANKITMAEAQSYGYVAPTFDGESIFANLSNGTVQAFDIDSLEVKWTYVDSVGGKGMTAVTCSDDLVFTGFWNGENKDASFVALNSKTGELKWSISVNGGFYWAGAYCTDNAVIFGTDDGSDKIAHIYSCDKETGEIISKIDVENLGDIRSSVVGYNNRIYVTTKGGYIVSAALNDSVLSDVKYGEIGAASTSTPTIYKDRIYIGAGDKTISVFDTNSLEKLFSVPVKAYPQCSPLLSTAHEDEGYLYLYTTYNSTPGGVTLIKIKTNAKSEADCFVEEVYDAEGYSQYCISDIIADDEGTLYYKNDSGYLFALKDNSEKVLTSLSEDGFIFSPTEIKVTETLAESYGYTDNVTGAVSALDVLVKIHLEIFGEDFTIETAEDYLLVSEEGYLSRIVGTDTYNFGFAVNEKAPHDDTMTDYGYTGYSINQAAVKSGDKVEFFIYRDSWAMDNYANFEMNGESINSIALEKNEALDMKLKGYTYAWYSCYDESMIESVTAPIKNAEIFVINTNTGNIEVLTSTNENGELSFCIDKPGEYIITAKESAEDMPLIAPWIFVKVFGVGTKEDDGKLIIEANMEKKTDVVVYFASYTEDVLNHCTRTDIALKKGYSKEEIDISDLSKNSRVFIWTKALTPFTEVK